MFQVPHLLVLLAAALSTALTGLWAAQASRAQVERVLKVCVILAVCFDPVYWLWELRHFGQIDPATTLPLYLCSLFWLLLPVAVFARKPLLRQMAAATVCTMGLLGGVLGLVFNVYLNQYPFFSFVPVRSLLYHILMVLTACILWASGYYRPQPRDRLLCFVPVGALVGVSLVLNRLFGWDYCYTAGGVGTPFEHLSAVLPRGLFLVVLYGGLLLLIQVLFYRPFLRRRFF